MNITELKQKANRLPTMPGVYLMLDKSGEIIYVGKAKSLKNRVGQYFSKQHIQSLKTMKMVENIADFETIFSKTELDAFLLENTLIKKHKPKYNILLKDDKGYPFVKLGEGQFARFSIVSRREGKGRFFGPFGGRGTANTAIKLLAEAFCLPNCTRRFPQDIGKQRPCLRRHLGKCIGVCTGEVTAEKFDDLLERAVMVLEGKGQMLVQGLTEQMESAAENLKFEQAASIRDMLSAVGRLSQNRIVLLSNSAEREVLAYCVLGARSCIARLTYINGSLVDKNTVFFEGLDSADESDALSGFIKQFYGRVAAVPKEILLSSEVEDAEGLAEYLSDIAGQKCILSVPKRGERVRLIELARENGRLELLEREQAEQRSSKTVEMLAQALSIEQKIKRIEAIDISNTAGDEPVAALTVFENGKPKKSAYKRYIIKTAAGGDDYKAMAEVLGRRLDRAIEGESGFLPFPDLILVDGGAGQVSVAMAQMKQRNLNIPLFGMVKDSKHRTRALISPDGREIGISATPALFAFIGKIQEETHRFAIEFHRERRGKGMKRSVLDGIKGIGENRKKALMAHFKSIKAISAASESELCEILPKDAAKAVCNHFKEVQK